MMFERPHVPGSRRAAWAILFAACVAVAAPAHAVKPQQWVHTTEADFADGEREGVVVTNLGDLKLARAVEELGELPEGVSVVFDIARIDGATYLAAGPEGSVLRLTDDGFETVAAFPGEQVFCLDASGGGLLIGVSGAPSRVMALDDDGELYEAVRLEGVRYVWDLHTRGLMLWIATGTPGRVFSVSIDSDRVTVTAGDEDVILDTEQANVLCLAENFDAGLGRLFAGTDTDGLIYRLSQVDGEAWRSYVVFDAPEPEIGSLVALPDGSLYAGTADANQARPGRLEEPATEQSGRPGGAPIEVEVDVPGELPETPPAPEPVGETDEAVAAPPTTPNAAEAADPADASIPPDADPPAAASPAEPTPEQYDRLRELVRARLDAARAGEPMQAGGPAGGGGGFAGPPSGNRVRPPAGGSASKPGNAIYRVDPEGFVSEVFRESVMVLRLVETDAGLLASTGNQGQVFRIDVADDETLVLADLEAEQVPAILPTGDGATLLGTANPGRLMRLTADRAEAGAYTSRVLDAQQISLWGTLRVTAAIPAGCRVEVETRSGNVGDPRHAAWSPWARAGVLDDAAHPALQPREATVASPPARFLQYRLRLRAAGDAEPVIDRVEANYVVPNLAPAVTAVTAERDEVDVDADDPAPTEVELSWEASDPNGDRLLFDLHFRPEGSTRFLKLADGLENAKFDWPTRRVPDGWYVVRVTASDLRDNPPESARAATRLSDPILVDHTPPALDAEVDVAPDGAVTLRGRAADERALIASIAYVANDDDRYVPILPADLILDSTGERYEVTLRGLAPGPHVITVRAVDALGNAAYQAVPFDVDP